MAVARKLAHNYMYFSVLVLKINSVRTYMMGKMTEWKAVSKGSMRFSPADHHPQQFCYVFTQGLTTSSAGRSMPHIVSYFVLLVDSN